MIVIILCIILIVVLCVYHLFFPSPTRIIWSYWHDENIPIPVQECIQTWKDQNPNYTVNFLNNKTYRQFIDVDVSKLRHAHHHPQRFTDYMRLLILKKYGGVWLDSTIILNKPLDSWIDHSKEYNGFYLASFTKENQPPMIETWFMQCKKNSKFISLWCDEFMRTNEFETIGLYLEDLKSKNVDFGYIMGPDYMATNTSCFYIIQNNKHFIDNFNLKMAELTAFAYINETSGDCNDEIIKNKFNPDGRYCDWKSKEAVDILRTGKYKDEPVIKLRGNERQFLNPGDLKTIQGLK